MFNLLAVRSSAIPRLTRLLSDPATPAEVQLQLSDQLEHEKTKAARGDMENALRRHNLLPAVFAMFKAMGESGGMGEFGMLRCGLMGREGRRGGEGEGKGEKGEDEGAREGGGVRGRVRLAASRSSSICIVQVIDIHLRRRSIPVRSESKALKRVDGQSIMGNCQIQASAPCKVSLTDCTAGDETSSG